MSEPLSYIIGPLPFCVPYASPGETGPGTHFPVELEDLAALCGWIWKVKTWSVTVSNLSNEFQQFQDYTVEVPNHARDDGSPDAMSGVICNHGFLWSHHFQVNDQDGDPGTFELRIEGFTTARRSPTASRWFPRLNVHLDMLFGAGAPVGREVITSTLDGPDLAGTLDADDRQTALYTGYPTQLFETWTADITMSPNSLWV